MATTKLFPKEKTGIAPESSHAWFAAALTCPLLNDAGIATAFAELTLRCLKKQRAVDVTDYGTD